ncbi:MAG TPA: hypothetical protein VGJ60_27875 [Chloroflexota bacterium]|jgi:vacuolar-type H+-ATPase subunit I/STV1
MTYLGILFIYQFGLNAIQPYLVLFVMQDIHQPDEVGFALAALLMLITAIGAIVLSVVVAAEPFLPRLGYRGIFVMLAVTIVLALLLLVRLINVPHSAQQAPASTQLAEPAEAHATGMRR